MLKSLVLASVCLAGVCASLTANAATTVAYGPPPAWVDVAPVPPTPPVDNAAAVQTLLDDNQSRLGPDGDVAYNRRITKILKPEGLASVSSFTLTWNPESQAYAVHTLRILRDGKVIDLLKGGRDMPILRRETNLERAMLDGQLTVTRQIEGLQTGDVLDMSWTVTNHDRVMAGHSYDMEGLGFAGVAGRYRARVSWPAAIPMRWKAYPGFGEPKDSTVDGRRSIDIDISGAVTPKPPLGAPPRFHRLGLMETSGFMSWTEVSRLMAPLYAKASVVKPGSPLKAEAAAIAARTTDPKARAFAALQLVQAKTRYFFIGMNSGGYVPADADLTWERKFGDCKGKTVLLLALLHELGVDAEPTLVSTTGGDGLDERLPSAAPFDHVIVRALIGGREYWLDGTGSGVIGGLDRQRPPPWRWALPLRAQGAELIPIPDPPFDEPQMLGRVRLDASKGLDKPATAQMQIRFLGPIAASLRRALAIAPKADAERVMRQALSGAFSWIQFDTIDWKDLPDDDAIELVLAGRADMIWLENPDVHQLEYRLTDTTNMPGGFPHREPGPFQDAPFEVPYPVFITSQIEVVLPDGGRGFSIRAPNRDEVIAGLELIQTSTLEGPVARFVVQIKGVKREISVAEADAATKAFRRLAADQTIIRAPASPRPAASRTQ